MFEINIVSLAELLPRQSADGYGTLQWTVGRDEYTEKYLVNKYSIKGEHGLNVNIQFFISLKSSSIPKLISRQAEWGKEVLQRFCLCYIRMGFFAAAAFLILCG